MRQLADCLAMLMAIGLATGGLARAAEPGAGDPQNGRKVYESRCGACHSLDQSRVGPMHRGVYGRKAGAVKNFNYSPAVKTSTIVWGADTLDQWLANPQALIPGQRMNFRLSDPQLRADVIAYLKKESGK